MKLTIAVCTFGSLEDTKGPWGCLIANTIEKENVELLVVDNGSPDNTVDFLNRFVFPYFPNHRLIQNEENVGVVKSLDIIHHESTGDVIAIPHNDLYIFEYGWNKRVMDEFENDPKLGLAGFLGAVGTTQNGGRHITMSNMLEAEAHGERIHEVKECVGFDGLCLIPRKAMLDQVGGFDQNYTYHHFYDRDIAVTSYRAGWTNKVIPIFCHHRSGVTANRPAYGDWIAKKMNTEVGKGDLASYIASEQYFIRKFDGYLPKMIGQPR